MKKFTSLPSLATKRNVLIISLVALAAIPAYSSGMASCLSKSQNPYYQGTATTITLGGKEYKIGRTHGTPLKTRATADDVIREAEGTEKLYSKSSAGTALLGNEMIMYKDEFPATTVWGDNNEVYFQDILSTIPTDTYVKGTLRDGTITLKAGQLVDYIEDPEYGDYGIAIGIARTEINYAQDTVDFHYDPSVTEYSIIVNADGSMSLQLPGEPFDGKTPPEYVLCLYYSDDGQFVGFSDFSQEYTPVDYQLITMPFGVTPEQYVYVDDFDYASFVDVAYTDSYIYIRGLDPMLPQGVVRAQIDGNTATIAQNQYVGNYMGMYYIFTKVAIDNPDYDVFKPGSQPYLFAPEDEGFTLTFDREAGLIVSENKGVYLSFQPDVNNFNFVNCFLEEFVLRYQATSAGTPANPSISRYFTDQAAYWGYADFQFIISNYSTEGYVLDVEDLYYQVLVNGEPIIFGEGPLINLNGREAIAYMGVPADQRWLPYLFSNDDDIMKWSSSEFDVGIYEPDVKTLGVQSLYVHEGVYTYSQIMTLDVETGEITASDDTNSVKVIPSGAVVKEEYFNLSGQKVENPQNGIFVKRVTYSNGKVTTVKQLIR